MSATAGFEDRFHEQALTAGVKVSLEELQALKRYYQLLQRWNQRINLTSLPLDGFPADALDRLLMEPLVAAQFVQDSPSMWVDLGSGGGSPAVPLKIVRPRIQLLMTESRGRKAAFLRETVRQLHLVHADVLSGRFEGLGDRASGSVDLITARAIRFDSSVSGLVSHLLRPGGQLLVFGFSETPHLVEAFEVIRTSSLPGRESRLGVLRRR